MEDQLAILASQIKEPIPVLERWKEILTCERTMAFDPPSTVTTLETVAMNLKELPEMPSARLQVFHAFDVLIGCADQGIDRFRLNVERQNGPEHPTYHRFIFLTPQEKSGKYSNCAASLVSAEELRRLTHTAISVKRFQLKNNRWPKSLAELSELGLSATEWSTTVGKFLGYSTNHNGAILQLYPIDPATTPPGTVVVEDEIELLDQSVEVR